MTKPGNASSVRPLRQRARSFVAGALALVGFALVTLDIGSARADLKLLPPEEAFRFSARALDAKSVEALFTIADGYYMYRDKFRFSVEPAGIAVVAPELPPGKIKEDEFFGRVETYRNRMSVRLSLTDAAPGQSVTLRADSQGCADVGVCYPPHAQRITLSMPQQGGAPGPLIDAVPQKKRWFN